jgi:PKD repeat protein
MAILGRNSPSGFGNFAAADQIRVYRVTVSGATVQLNELYASLSNSGTTVTVRMVCYDDDGTSGDPGTLLAVTPDISVPNSGYTTRGGAVVAAAVLSAGNYWIGVHIGGPNSLAYDDDGSGLTRRSNTDTFVGGAANPWAGTGANITGSIQCWGVTGAVVSVPVADFTGTPLTGIEPLSVAFTDTSTNTPTSWAWTFGDGGTSTSQNPTHSYTSAGTFTVTLVATNSAGSNTKTRTGYVTASDQPRPVLINTTGGWVNIADHSSFVSGSGAPTAAIGANGAIYLDVTNKKFYGPKAGGAWPGTAIGTLT